MKIKYISCPKCGSRSIKIVVEFPQLTRFIICKNCGYSGAKTKDKEELLQLPNI